MLVLDTHAWIWWAADKPKLSRKARAAIEAERSLAISDISLWEVATLCELGRIRLRLPLREWLEQVVALAQVERAGISPAVAAEVAALPPTFHRDPADRIIVASARIHGARLLTHDRRIIASRLVPTVA